MKFLKKYKHTLAFLAFLFAWGIILSYVARSKVFIQTFTKITRDDAKYEFQSALFKQQWSHSKCKIFVVGDLDFAEEIPESKNVTKFLVSGLDYMELDWVLTTLTKEKYKHLFIQSSPHMFSNLDHDEGSSGPRPDTTLWRQYKRNGLKHRLYDIEIFFESLGTMAEYANKEKNVDAFKLLTYEYLSILDKNKLQSFFSKFKQENMTWVNDVTRFPIQSNLPLLKQYNTTILKNHSLHVIEVADLSDSIEQELSGCK